MSFLFPHRAANEGPFFEHVPALSELADRSRSDRQNKALAKAAARVVGAPLTHAQWLQHLRDGNLEALDAAHAMPPRSGDPVAAGFARDVACTTSRATSLALARELGLETQFGCTVDELRIGFATLQVDPSVVGSTYSIAARLVSDIPRWLAHVTGCGWKLSLHGPSSSGRVYLWRPLRPGVTTVEQMVDEACTAAGIDRSVVTIVPGRWSDHDHLLGGPGPLDGSDAAVALARLGGRLPADWTTLNVLESPGSGWPLAINLDAGVGVTCNLNELHLYATMEELVDVVDDDDEPGVMWGPDGRGSRMLDVHDHGDSAGVTIGRLAEILCGHARDMDTGTLIAALDEYEGEDVWEDIIHVHGFDEAATTAVDPNYRSDRFVLVDGTLVECDERSRTWSAGRAPR
jgi:hypothetical protein